MFKHQEGPMTKRRAIAWYRAIQNGKAGGYADRQWYIDKFGAGAIAANLIKHADVNFCYGVEYGILIAIARIFNLTEDDFKGEE